MREDLENMLNGEELDLYNVYWSNKAEKKTLILDVDDFISILNICIFQHDYDKAEIVMADALEQHPNDEDVYLGKVQLLAEMDNMTDAFELLNEIDQKYPENIERVMLRGSMYIVMERYKEGEAALKLYESRGGERGVTGYGLSQCLSVRGKRDAAFEYLKGYLQSNLDSIEVFNRFTSSVQEWEMVDQAIEYVRELLLKASYNKNLWKVLYELYEYNEDYENAYEANEYVLAIDPNDYEAHGRRILSAQYSNLEDLDRSFNLFRPEKWGEEQCTFFFYCMADYYVDSKNWEKEVNCFKRLYTCKIPDYTKARVAFKIAEIEDRNFHLKEAIMYYKEAVAFFEKSNENEILSVVYQGLGKCYLLLDELQIGLEYEEKAWKLDPQRDSPFYEYVINACILGKEAEMLEIVEELILEEPERAAFMLAKGVVFFYLTKQLQAVSWFIMAFEHDPKMRIAAKEVLKDILREPAISDALSPYLD